MMCTTHEAFRQEVDALRDAKQQFREVHEEIAGVASDLELAR